MTKNLKQFETEVEGEIFNPTSPNIADTLKQKKIIIDTIVNDKRYSAIIPFALQVRAKNLDTITEMTRIKAEKLDETITAISNAFNIVAVDALTNPMRMIFFGVVLADLMLIEAILMHDLGVWQAHCEVELQKDIINYYKEVPKF